MLHYNANTMHIVYSAITKTAWYTSNAVRLSPYLAVTCTAFEACSTSVLTSRCIESLHFKHLPIGDSISPISAHAPQPTWMMAAQSPATPAVHGQAPCSATNQLQNV